MPNVKNLAYKVYSKQGDVVYGQATSVLLFTLPRGARPIRVTVYSQAASVSATLSLGIASDDNLWVSALDVSAKGVLQASLLIADLLVTKTDVYVMIGGSPSSGGPFTVMMEYVYTKSRGL